jgi:hypothetical protein
MSGVSRDLRLVRGSAAASPAHCRFQGAALAMPTIASQFKIAFHSSR